MSPSSDDNIDYSYTNRDWTPTIGNQSRPNNNNETNVLGYHNLNGLRNSLKQIKIMAKAITEVAEKNLENFSLTIEPDSRLYEAQQQEWPKDLGEPRSYISYKQYKGLEPVRSRGAEYIRSSYENQIRGPFGVNAIDAIISVSAIKNEADNIEDFLDNYIGDVNGTSEFRALELLQDWAETAIGYTKDIGDTLKEGVKSAAQIPAAELDKIGETEVKNYQAFFQTKVNAVNREINLLTDDVKKEYHLLSEVYYKKHLGPALKFQRMVASPLSRQATGETFLGVQAAQADQALGADYITLLVDQMKRNENFETKMRDLILKVKLRDSYAGFTQQLNAKLEKQTNSPFVSIAIGAEESDGLDNFRVAAETTLSTTSEFSSSHALLDGKDEDTAHPQYLLKAGDTVTGDILVAAGIKIDGVDLSEHRHRGIDVDGTPKIKGVDIEDLVTTSIKKDEDICYPVNLRHINNKPYTGTNNVTLVNSQIAWDCDPNMTFELQTVPVSAVANPVAPALDWCVTTLYETALPIVAGLGSDFSFFTFCTATAVYNYNWTTGTLTTIAGSEGNYGDGTNGDSITRARFSNIVDLAQDFFDGRVYIADSDNRKVKMTGKAATSGHTLPMDVTTVFSCAYPIKRLDTQGQNFLNTLYVVAGPDGGGKDRVYKLVDTDGNNLASGTYAATEITKLSGVYSDIIDIAATPNGFVYLLKGTTLYQYDPNINTVRSFNVADDVGIAVPTAITSDQYNDIYITYSTI